MSASTADRQDTNSPQIGHLTLPVAASTNIFKNCHVSYDANGNIALAADTVNHKYAGWSRTSSDNSAGIAGAKSVEVVPPCERYRYFTFVASGADQTWCGKIASFVYDNEVALAATTTNDIAAGTVVKVYSATSVLVDTMRRANPPAAA